MVERIPQRIDHYRYTDKGVVLEGVITRDDSKRDLPRFHEYIINAAEDIKYRLEFDRDTINNRVVNGFIQTQAVLQCQRCMSNFTVDLNCDVSIAFVHNQFEQKQAENASYEVFWLDKKEFFDPRILIEDELLLALPQIPMHPESEVGQACQVQLEYPADAEPSSDELKGEQVDSQKETNNPFAILKQLKK